jgi:epoxyqueuosine reductase QueG
VSRVALKFPWSRKDTHNDDPYWDFFINTPPADPTNTVTELLRNAPAGNVFPTQADIHTPEIMAHHVKEMARYFGAELVGIARLEADTLAAQAGLGTLNAAGRLVTPQFGAKVYIADAICTDLPLAADG